MNKGVSKKVPDRENDAGIKERKCRGCGIWQPLKDYHLTTDGYRNGKCDACLAAYQRKYHRDFYGRRIRGLTPKTPSEPAPFSTVDIQGLDRFLRRPRPGMAAHS